MSENGFGWSAICFAFPPTLWVNGVYIQLLRVCRPPCICDFFQRARRIFLKMNALLHFRRQQTWGDPRTCAQKRASCLQTLSVQLFDSRSFRDRQTPSGGLLGPLCGLALQMLQNDPLEPSWGHFPRWRLKCSKTTLWRPPGATLRAGA